MSRTNASRTPVMYNSLLSGQLIFSLFIVDSSTLVY
jgi:hypothetical protein